MAGVTFTPEAASRIAEAARYVLANRSILGGPAQAPGASPAEAFTALCTSAAADARGNYPGLVTRYDGPTSSVIVYGACRLRPLNGEVPTSGDEYLAIPCGATPEGELLYRIVVTCCGSSGSGSGEVVVPCCPGVAIPRTLYLSVTGAGGCNTSTPIVLAYNGGATWDTHLFAGARGTHGYLPFGICDDTDTGHPGIAFSLSCASGWFLTLTDNNVGLTSSPAFASADCAPFKLVFQTVKHDSSDRGCCDGAGPFIFTITDTPTSTGCFAGVCGSSGVSATLTATVTGATGCYTALPSSFTMDCLTVGSQHVWEGTATLSACGFSFAPGVGPGGAGEPVLSFGGSGGSLFVEPDAGWSCSPFSALYHIDDGSGNSCTVTVVG